MEVIRGRERVGGEEIEWEWSIVLYLRLADHKTMQPISLKLKKEERILTFTCPVIFACEWEELMFI